METLKDPLRSHKDAIYREIFETALPSPGSDEQKTKMNILYAAAGLFARKGYNGAAVREIVHAAGVTKPTLYYYFRNKEDLYLKLLELAEAVFLRFIDRAADEPGTARRRVIRLYTWLYRLLLDHVDLLKIFNVMFFGPRDATPNFDCSRCDDYFKLTLSDILTDGEARGELHSRDHDTIMFLLVGLMRNIESMIVLDPENPGVTAEDISNAVDFIFGCSPAAVENREIKS